MAIPKDPVLLHGHAPYDAQKAHQYYVDHYKAHPRQKGTTFTVKTADGSTVKVSAKDLVKEKAYASHRVNSIRTRLAKLNQELKNKLDAAQKSASTADKPETAAEKAKAAKDSKEYREKHKTELKTKAKETSTKTTTTTTKSTPTDSVDDLKVKIAGARSNLKQAIARQRSLATAKKN